ncbi:AraC family transcriptional regulator [Amycolatopsis suaedae]|uniref:AraC family transcriptional regulator n=1 Tax=Amycolatopsis suaedae TaxID=2510978 RepID=A0A4Q7J273_9PSEU|nr:AraC family transcriptional regulator [Amycolatopsis suaedae]RZQ60616.1 AraC family transcriptional regulator [Amycolatopsis suaedae]
MDTGVRLPTPAVRDWDFPRSAASVLLMTRFAAERGVDARELLRGSGLTAERVRDPDTQIDAGQELRVVRALTGALGGGDAVALELGSRYRVSTFGIFGFACVSSPTLRDTIAFALRYLDLSFTFAIPRVEVAGGELRMRMHDELVPADVRRPLVLRDLAAIVTVLRDLLPDIRLTRLEFAFEGEATGQYREVFGTDPVFGAPAHVGAVDAAYLDRPLPQANEHTVAICEAHCRELLARRRARTGITHEVRERLVRVDGLSLGMAEVAAALNLSERTLRRRLAEAGTSFRQLADEVRQAVAEELLATGALTVQDVAVRLGYAEASSFIYAFKRWKGMTPAAFVRGLRR